VWDQNKFYKKIKTGTGIWSIHTSQEPLNTGRVLGTKWEGKKDRCLPRPCSTEIRGTLVGYLVPSGKKKNLRPVSAMPPSHSPFWDKGGKKDACKKKNVDHKKK
jgi:hypothetical protein